MDRSDGGVHIGLGAELALLRERVTGVRGVIVTGVDGLLIAHEGTTDCDPYDLAALAAAAHGIGRRTADVLRQSDHQQLSIQNSNGHYVVYAVDEVTLLGVVAGANLNIAQLHIQFRASVTQLDKAVREHPRADDRL